MKNSYDIFGLNLLSVLGSKNPLFYQVTIYQCEAKGVVKLLQAYMDADVSFYWQIIFWCPIALLRIIWVKKIKN